MQTQQFIAALLLGSLSFLSWAESTASFKYEEAREATPPINNSTRLALNDAIARTLENNPQLYQYYFRQQSLAIQRETSSRSPALRLGLEVENFAGNGDFSGVDNAETTLALSSVIELGGKARSRTAVVDARSDHLNFERQAATLDVLGELTTVFIRCLSAQESIRLAEDAIALSEQMMQTVKLRAERGAASEAEVMRASAALTRASIRLNALRSRYERQKVALSNFWGETKPYFVQLQGGLTTFDRSDNFANLYRRAQNSPAIRIFASEARLKDAEVKLAQAQSRVDIGWQLGVRRFEESNDTALAVGISIPLFAGKRNRGAVATALSERNAVDYQQADATLKLHNRLFAAYSQREENKSAAEQISSKILPTLEKALLLTRQAYENGRYRYQDWIAAQEELLSARQQHLEAATAAQLSQALIEQLISEPLQDNGLTH